MNQKTSKKAAERLQDKEIHIHLLRTSEKPSQSSMDTFLPFLPPDERQQYQSFELESRRREFLLSRLFTRQLLAFYTGKEMGNLKWGVGGKGKPFLEDSPLQFSLSHTQGLIACSVGYRKVGVDVEKIEDGFLRRERSQLLAGRFFSLPERDYLQSLPSGLHHLAFLRIFTMKEAYAKALGSGLSCFPNGLTVPITYEEQSRKGSWEWFTRIVGGHCLSNVLENPDNSFYKHEIFQWNEKSLINAIKNNHSSGWNQLCA